MDEFVIADSYIRQLHARVLDAVWRQDAGEFASCFATDGEWKIGGMHLIGRAKIEEAFASLLGRCAKVQLIPTQSQLDVTGQTAAGRHHMLELAKLPDGRSVTTIGVYHDKYVVEDRKWRFASRFWSLKYRGPSDLSADFVNTSDYGPFPSGPRSDEQSFALSKK